MLKPFDWSVVIAGRWNRAILTPAGIRERVFGKEDELPLTIEIPIDLLRPPKVTLDNISVVADWSKLVIAPIVPKISHLLEACICGQRAIDSLPQTPFQAVAYNLNFRAAEAQCSLDSFLQSAQDNAFLDNQLTIQTWGVKRELEWKLGRVNLSIERNDEGDFVHMNVERQSEDPSELKEWLAVEKGEIVSILNTFLNDCLGLEVRLDDTI